ncbi:MULTISPECIES: C40 family peptidase [Delftia]|uniref:C40 family peptidase n=1 Tax=Delftia TaxID=80865 RepID=UPI00064842D2|nr:MULTISPECIES: C40 family peptidase [Delftia]MDC2861710.1 C40 family peptidase [Delftia sp. DT-2]MDH0847838.1 C40 family peptidase [Delftia tsuruhatensis]WEL96071.1 C40 family peptidase [Delftia tsuruhatensis]WQM85748.1 C40 family peptidase [Delftia tsuruhatensis]
MSRWLIALLFVSATAHAAPPEMRDDDMNQLLVNRSLISQLREARHHMAERTSDFVKEARQSVAEKTSDLVVTAMGFIGVPYRRGGNSAETGFDCSGFVRAIYSETLGKVLPRRADQQAQATEKIDKNELKPGDLVFFNTMRRAFSHVGIYVGDGNFIHAPRTGAQVRVESMQSAYWARRFDGARRVQDSDGLGLDASKAALAMQMQASQLQ